MIGIIRDNGNEFRYENLNFVRIQNNRLIINYNNKYDEEREEIWDDTESLEIYDENNEWVRLKRYLHSAEDALYPNNSGSRATRCWFALARNNIKSIEQLNNCKVDELKKFNGLGNVSLDIAVRAIRMYEEEKDAK